MTAAKYVVFLTNEGVLRITHSDGSPISPDTVEWFRQVLRAALRFEAQASTYAARQGVIIDTKRAEAGKLDDPQSRFEIDELILLLEEERSKQGIQRSKLAKLIFTSSQRLTDYARGWARPTMETLRIWAFMLGWQIRLIPSDLAPRVDNLVKKWVEQRDKTLPEVQ